MDLETVIQREVSQKDKTRYRTLMYMKNGTDDLICKAKRETDIENKYMDTKGEKRWWEKLGDSNRHIHTIDAMYKIGN